jgi:hypothetical protein
VLYTTFLSPNILSHINADDQVLKSLKPYSFLKGTSREEVFVQGL